VTAALCAVADAVPRRGIFYGKAVERTPPTSPLARCGSERICFRQLRTKMGIEIATATAAVAVHRRSVDELDAGSSDRGLD
jgi:hypothetical protein